MTHFEDLTPHSYTLQHQEEGVLNVGWLGVDRPFPTGTTSAAFREALDSLCQRPIGTHRGFHVCEFCGNDPRHDWTRIGNGQIRIRSQAGSWYVAPTMVQHYVVEHSYRPPAVFMSAVLDPAQVADSLPGRPTP